jgi:hypothetical protein
MERIGIGMLAGEASGAIRNGRTVIKQNSEPGDAHPDGTLGTVMSSIPVPIEIRAGAIAEGYGDCEYFYFIDWGGGIPVGTIDSKVKENV